MPSPLPGLTAAEDILGITWYEELTGQVPAAEPERADEPFLPLDRLD